MNIHKNKMTIPFIRSIDFWVGVPLCFLLTFVDSVLRLFSSHKRHEDIPKKILFIKPSEMGGIILSYPLFSRIQKEYPQAEMFFLTFKSNQSLFEVLGVIPTENILTIREDLFLSGVVDTVRAIFKIRRIKVDVVFDLEFFSRVSALIAYLTGAAKRIGFDRYTLEGLYRGDLFTHKLLYNPHIHISQVFLSMSQVVGQDRKTTPELMRNFSDHEIVLPQFSPTKEEAEIMKNRLAELGIDSRTKLFLMNPGEGRIPLREWPLDHFITLARKLLEDQNHYMIMTGASDSAEKSTRLFHALDHKRCIDLIGKTTIRELLTLFHMADVLIANDSGLAHLASLTQIKQFILFGPESPRVFSPLGENIHVFYSNLPCSPCLSAYNHRRSDCTHNRCLKGISPEEVHSIILKKVPQRSLFKNSLIP